MTKEIKLKWLLIGSVISSAGSSFVWPLTTIYMHNYLGKSLTFSGIVLLINSVATIIGNYAGGYLFDKWRPYYATLVGIVIAWLAVLGLVFMHGWPAYPILLVILGLGNGIVATILNSFAATIRRKDSRYVFNLFYLALNLGIVIGTLLVGYVIEVSVTMVFVSALILYSIFLITAILAYRVDPIRKKVKPTKSEESGRVNPKVWIIGAMWLTFLVIWLSYEQWQSNLSIYMDKLDIPLSQYSLLWTINAGLIVFGQPLVSLVTRTIAKSLFRQIIMGVGLFALSFTTLIFAKDFSHFVFSMVLLTLGEMVAFPAIPAWINELAEPGQEGKAQGTINIAASIGKALGPLVGGIVIERLSYNGLFVGSTLLILLALAVVVIATKKANIRS